MLNRDFKPESEWSWISFLPVKNTIYLGNYRHSKTNPNHLTYDLKNRSTSNSRTLQRLHIIRCHLLSEKLRVTVQFVNNLKRSQNKEEVGAAN
jgi:hypothetical protein